MDKTQGRPPFINQMLSAQAWAGYVAAYDFGPVAPTRLVLHHTYIPSEAQWRGLASMRGMQSHYAGLGWTAGPHIYAGPDGIWLATPMRDVGIHAGTGNSGRVNGRFWYSIGLEMVGFFDRTLPAGAVWEHSKAVMGGLSRRLNIPPRELISFHRHYNTPKSCPGWAVKEEWVFAEVEAWLHATAPSSGAITADTPLLGGPRVSPDQCKRYILARPHGEYDAAAVDEIVGAYSLICLQAGLDPLLAIAQMIHETGNLTSWWAARPRRNPAGIGVTGRVEAVRPGGGAWAQRGPAWCEGASFETWQGHAVPAHVGRLLAYALPEGQATPEQQSLIDYALRVRPLASDKRGVARTLRGLGGTWAVPGTDYGDRVAAVANAILAS